MSLANLSVKRPIFISSIVLIMILVGWLSMNKLTVRQRLQHKTTQTITAQPEDKHRNLD